MIAVNLLQLCQPLLYLVKLGKLCLHLSLIQLLLPDLVGYLRLGPSTLGTDLYEVAAGTFKHYIKRTRGKIG